MMRRQHRAEANTILAVAAVYFIYNSGYWLPFGGGTPGPRFLIPALPFVAIGLAYAYKRLPALTLGLAIPSTLMMLVGTLTYPLLGRQGVGTWADWLMQGRLEHTVLTAFGVTNAWLAIAPFVAAIATAIVLAVRATPSTSLSDFRFAVPAVLTWACVSAVGPASPATTSARSTGQQLCALARRRRRAALGRDARRVWLRDGGLSPARRRPGREPSLGPGLALGDRPRRRPARATGTVAPERQAGDRLALRAGLRRALRQAEVEDDGAHPVRLQLADRGGVGEGGHVLDQVEQIVGLVLARPLTMSGKPSVDPSW